MNSRQQGKFQSRIIVTVTAAILIAIAITGYQQTNYAIGVGQQGRERLLHRLPTATVEPITITSVKIDGKDISFDEKFAANDNWLSTLTISFKNRSPQLILLASFRLVFPRPSGSSEPVSLGNVFYGDPELLARRPNKKEQLVGIPPGETATVGLQPDQFQAFQDLLKETGYPPNIERVNLKINSVIFQDDTMWKAGEILHRDKQNPNSWWVEPRPSGKVKTPTFRSPNVRAAHHRPATLMTAFLDARYGRKPSRFSSYITDAAAPVH